MNRPALTLYHYWRSSSSWRVRMALSYKGVNAEMIPVSLLDGESESLEHVARSPFGYVPVLKVGERNIVESVAMIEWLEENYPMPSLYPGDSLNRAQIRGLCEIVNAGTQPLQNPNTVDQVAENLPNNEKKRTEWIQYFIKRGLNAFQKYAVPYSGKYCVGDAITAADLFLVPQVYAATRFGVPIDEFPVLKSINDELYKLDFVKATVPEKYQSKEAK